MESYFTADLHLGHKNIVRGISEWKDTSVCRDFETLNEHDNKILNNINNVVKENDILYVIGDFVMGGKQNIPYYRSLINCKNIVLVKGNHDLHMHKNSIVISNDKFINVNTLFKKVVDIEDIVIGKRKVFMCHYPCYTWHRKSRGSIHLYGHTHKELDYDPKAICVSLECNNLKPFSLNQIIKIYERRNSKNVI